MSVKYSFLELPYSAIKVPIFEPYFEQLEVFVDGLRFKMISDNFLVYAYVTFILS